MNLSLNELFLLKHAVSIAVATYAQGSKRSSLEDQTLMQLEEITRKLTKQIKEINENAKRNPDTTK